MICLANTDIFRWPRGKCCPVGDTTAARHRLWWPGALLTDSAAKAKAPNTTNMSWHSLLPEAEADDDVAATIKSVRQQLLNLISLVAYRSN